ncbi:hypothetical protein [Paenibacillus montanisoli]|uniref:hypothetical protein n=1 Tax=Paenibacillus montanisoli TaxID=2081970 RepID=UPI00197D0252|nr:hypothetical protein [Paenibacillus montanisoli]
MEQYRFDRDPRPKGKPSEPLLNFPSGALVHFAVSNSEVRMATKLQEQVWERDSWFIIEFVAGSN